MSGGTGPGGGTDLDDWVLETLLNPASAMFREGNVLLSEGNGLDTSIYLSVLAAISQGNVRRGDIAAAVGRPSTAVAHPLAVLAEAGFVTPQVDAVRQRRTTFHLAEPVLRLHQLVVAPNEGRLLRHQAAAVWASVADTVSSKIYGPHFETVARDWCLEWATEDTLGGVPAKVASTEVSCPEHRGNHEVDVAVTEVVAGRPDRVIALGEAKWRIQPSGIDQVRRLDHLRDRLGLPVGTKLLLFSRSGFAPDVHDEADRRQDVELVDLARLYGGT